MMQMTRMTPAQARLHDRAVAAGWSGDTLLQTAEEMAAKGCSAAMERSAYTTRGIEAGRAFLEACFPESSVRVVHGSDWFWYEEVRR